MTKIASEKKPRQPAPYAHHHERWSKAAYNRVVHSFSPDTTWDKDAMEASHKQADQFISLLHFSLKRAIGKRIMIKETDYDQQIDALADFNPKCVRLREEYYKLKKRVFNSIPAPTPEQLEKRAKTAAEAKWRRLNPTPEQLVKIQERKAKKAATKKKSS